MPLRRLLALVKGQLPQELRPVARARGLFEDEGVIDLSHGLGDERGFRHGARCRGSRAPPHVDRSG